MSKITRILSIHVTDKCNNQCIFCVVDAPSQTVEQVTRRSIETFLEEHQDQGFDVVNLHGGEPTTRKDFWKILQKINECGYPSISIQTNGRRLSDEAFAKKTCEYGVELFIVSLHGKDETTQDLITEIPGSFQQAVQGIKNVKKFGAKVRSNTVVSRVNYTQLPEIMDVLFSLQIDHINISALHTGGTAYKNFDLVTPTYTEIGPIVRQTVEKVIHHGTRVSLEGFPLCTIPGLEQYVRDWGTEKLKMLYRGIVFEDYADGMDRKFRFRGTACIVCKQNKKCGGVYQEYIEKCGWDEFGYKNPN